MTLRCTACNRVLLRFCVSNIGADGVEYGWGPKCADRHVVVRPGEGRKRGKTFASYRPKARRGDPRQLDWVETAAMPAEQEQRP